VLGSLNAGKKWEWCANGKHPASRDYFRIATQHPLLNAFIEWMDKGYTQLKTRPEYGRTLYSWRFWVKGALPDTLVCGIIRDSSDGLGRPYPLLIIGAGTVIKWRSHLELLPFALENTWKQMESLAAGRFSDLQSLKKEIGRLAPPLANWRLINMHLKESETRRSDRGAPRSGDDINRLPSFEKPVSQQEQLFWEIMNPATENPLNLARSWSLQLVKQSVDPPSAFVMGGIPEKSYLGFFFRPLGIRDFTRLWSIESDDNRLPAQTI